MLIQAKKNSMNQPLPRNSKVVIIFLHINVFLYALCYWTQSRALLQLAQRYMLDSTTLQVLYFALSVVNLIAEPIFGWLCDEFGSRKILICAYLSAALSYILLGISESIAMIILSRIPKLLTHAMLGAQTIMSNISEPKQTAGRLGLLNFSYGVGTIFGLMASNWCAENSQYRVSAYIAAFGSLLSFCLVHSFIPSQTETASLQSNLTKGSKHLKSFMPLTWINANTRSMLLISFVATIPIATLDKMFVMMSHAHFGNDRQTTEASLRYMEILSMMTQGFIVGRLISFGYSDRFLMKAPVAILSLSFAALGLFVMDWRSFCIIAILMTLAWSIFTLVLLAKLTTTVQKNDTGAILGLQMGLYSFIRMITPLVVSFLLQESFIALGVLGFICNGILYLYLSSKSLGQIVRI